jgi:hypothetical protein
MAQLVEIVIDCLNPARLAKFWADALSDYHVRPYNDEDLARLASAGLTPETDPSIAVDGNGPILWFQKTDEPKTQQRNRLHLDIRGEDRATEVARLRTLGATIRDEHGAYTVMLDPEGNEFCVQDQADN